MNRIPKTFLRCSLLMFCVVALGACAAPKVLVDQKFLGEKRTVKIILQQNEVGLFNQYVRVCTLEANGTESACKDTLILDNVI